MLGPTSCPGPEQRQPTLDGGRRHQVGHLSGRAPTRLHLSCSLGHTRGMRGRRGPLPSPILTPRFSTTAMRGLPSHRLGFLCFLVLICFCFCWFVLNFCLESLRVVGELFLRTFLPSPPASRGPCILTPLLVRPLTVPCSSTMMTSFPFCFSFKEKLGPAGPGVSRTKAMVLQ